MTSHNVKLRVKNNDGKLYTVCFVTIIICEEFVESPFHKFQSLSTLLKCESVMSEIICVIIANGIPAKVQNCNQNKSFP